MKKAFSATPNRYSNKGKRWAGKRFKITNLRTAENLAERGGFPSGAAARMDAGFPPF